MLSHTKALEFTILSECKFSKARASLMKLPSFTVELPMFMPVGTQGTMKGLTPEQVKDSEAQIILGNTYHLGTRPGKILLEKFEGLHKFMQWDRALLTDSGGFQMVSLLKLAEITEEGVKFQSPFDGSECMLTPEESIRIQNSIGADIMMQLDDVVNVRESNYDRFQVAVGRTTRWLDRCIKANANPSKQNLFPVVQGGLFPDLRKQSLKQLIERDTPGYAIGGLSGGEDKNMFWPIVNLCTDHLPKEKPRYCMGVGFPVDVVVCCALGVDMFDCVYPTRTARFGCALANGGQINLKSAEYKFDFSPIDEKCDCLTCKSYTKAYLRTIVTKETVACHLISMHNIAYMMRLMQDIRESIKMGRFVNFVREFMNNCYKDGNVPQWVVDALSSVNISLREKNDRKTEGAASDPDWDSGEDESEYLERMSGFGSFHFSNAFREAVLEDNTKAFQNGRLRGFIGATLGVCASDGDASQDNSFRCNNPIRTLSRWVGALSACLTLRQKDLNTKDKQIIEELLERIQKLLDHFYSPPTNTVDKSFQLWTDNDSIPSNHDDVSSLDTLKKCNGLIEECEHLCQRLNWKTLELGNLSK